MAASSPLSSFLSFLLPSKPPAQPKAPPSHLSVSVSSSSSSSSASSRRRDGGGSLALAAAAAGGPQQEASAVMCPSLAYANTLYFRSAYNVQVLVDDNEPEERLLNRFRREVMRAGVIQECKRRRFHENKQEEKKRKTREAAKRNRRRRPPPRFSAQYKPEAVPSNKRAEDEDNWDLPEGDIPY